MILSSLLGFFDEFHPQRLRRVREGHGRTSVLPLIEAWDCLRSASTIPFPSGSSARRTPLPLSAAWRCLRIAQTMRHLTSCVGHGMMLLSGMALSSPTHHAPHHVRPRQMGSGEVRPYPGDGFCVRRPEVEMMRNRGCEVHAQRPPCFSGRRWSRASGGS